MTTSLLIIDAEARRLLRRLPVSRMQALQASVIALCEAAWRDIRGPEPATRLAKALWEIPPHFADIFVHLYGIADPRLAGILEHLAPPQALALLVLAEIERGDAEGARSAYAAMRVFESPSATTAHVRAILTASGGHAPEAWLRHAHRPALWRAVVGLAIQSGRWDAKAVLECIRQVAQSQVSAAELAGEPDMQRIMDMLRELGITFLAVEKDRVTYALRGEQRKPVRYQQVIEMLAEGWEAHKI